MNEKTVNHLANIADIYSNGVAEAGDHGPQYVQAHMGMTIASYVETYTQMWGVDAGQNLLNILQKALDQSKEELQQHYEIIRDLVEIKELDQI